MNSLQANIFLCPTKARSLANLDFTFWCLYNKPGLNYNFLKTSYQLQHFHVLHRKISAGLTPITNVILQRNSSGKVLT